jgi:hypothetical protein
MRGPGSGIQDCELATSNWKLIFSYKSVEQLTASRDRANQLFRTPAHNFEISSCVETFADHANANSIIFADDVA